MRRERWRERKKDRGRKSSRETKLWSMKKRKTKKKTERSPDPVLRANLTRTAIIHRSVVPVS